LLGPPPHAIRRVVSLCPSLTETLFDLGAAPLLVGLTRFCVQPAEGVARLPKVGGTKDPDLDAIRRLSPDLVLVNREENRREDALALAQELPVHASHPRSVEEVPGLLRELGELLGVAEEAERRALRIEERLAGARERRGRENVPSVVLVWRDPWIAAGGGTYLSSLARLAGGENVFPVGRGDWPATDSGELVRLRPRLVILPDEPFPFGQRHREELGTLLPEARIVLVPGEDWCWHGTRTEKGIDGALALRRESMGE
jgi:ABC-type Fe3+-hydroxamate transport system substrate-binding protein